jgi:hypothetical protein
MLRRCYVGRVERSPSPAPPAATPPASPSTATSNKSDDQEQQYRTDGRVHDCADHSRTEMDTELRQQPASDQSAQNPDNEVPDDPKAGASDNLTCQPARNETDKQYHQQAFARHIHGAISHSGWTQHCKPGCRRLYRIDRFTAASLFAAEYGSLNCSTPFVSTRIIAGCGNRLDSPVGA